MGSWEPPWTTFAVSTDVLDLLILDDEMRCRSRNVCNQTAGYYTSLLIFRIQCSTIAVFIIVVVAAVPISIDVAYYISFQWRSRARLYVSIDHVLRPLYSFTSVAARGASQRRKKLYYSRWVMGVYLISVFSASQLYCRTRLNYAPVCFLTILPFSSYFLPLFPLAIFLSAVISAAPFPRCRFYRLPFFL